MQTPLLRRRPGLRRITIAQPRNGRRDGRRQQGQPHQRRRPQPHRPASTTPTTTSSCSSGRAAGAFPRPAPTIEFHTRRTNIRTIGLERHTAANAPVATTGVHIVVAQHRAQTEATQDRHTHKRCGARPPLQPGRVEHETPTNAPPCRQTNPRAWPRTTQPNAHEQSGRTAMPYTVTTCRHTRLADDAEGAPSHRIWEAGATTSSRATGEARGSRKPAERQHHHQQGDYDTSRSTRAQDDERGTDVTNTDRHQTRER